MDFTLTHNDGHTVQIDTREKKTFMEFNAAEYGITSDSDDCLFQDENADAPGVKKTDQSEIMFVGSTTQTKFKVRVLACDKPTLSDLKF